MLFGCGALLLRGAGCTINDLLDRDIDIKVNFQGEFSFSMAVLPAWICLIYLDHNLFFCPCLDYNGFLLNGLWPWLFILQTHAAPMAFVQECNKLISLIPFSLISNRGKLKIFQCFIRYQTSKQYHKLLKNFRTMMYICKSFTNEILSHFQKKKPFSRSYWEMCTCQRWFASCLSGNFTSELRLVIWVPFPSFR